MLPLFSRQAKQLVQVAYDSVAAGFSAVITLYFNGLDDYMDLGQTLVWLAATSIAAPALFSVGGAYRNVVRFLAASVAIRLGVMSGFVGLASALMFSWIDGVYSWRIIFDVGLLLGAAVLLPRGLLRILVEREALTNKPVAIIYGAGSAGRQLLSTLRTAHDYRVIGFVDDDLSLSGATIMGHPVWQPYRVGEIVKKHDVKTVLLAIPSAGLAKRKKIVADLETLNLEVLTVPTVKDLISGKASVTELKQVAIEDLLGREPVDPVPSLIAGDIESKTVVVTGAGGSIGSELCRQVIRQRASALVLVEVTEFALYSIEQELQALCSSKGIQTKLVPILASVVNEARIRRLFKSYNVDTVYHAAAYKHVPLVEGNATRAIVNNALATYRLAKAALAAGVGSFVLVSTDKAVRPTNVMGASKRMAELAVQALASNDADEKQHVSIVRFGNVLGSSGSVVPLFRKQIAGGGPVTITHPDIIRYFMTIPEAAQLVIQAGAMAKRGDVFVLDMGEPVRIVDLAKRMIRLSGLVLKDADNPNGDVELEFTGLRPGEKLFEELLVSGEEFETDHERIRRIVEPSVPVDELESLFLELEVAVGDGDLKTIKAIMEAMPLHWKPSSERLQDYALEEPT